MAKRINLRVTDDDGTVIQVKGRLARSATITVTPPAPEPPPPSDRMGLYANMPMVAGWSVENNEPVDGVLDPQYVADMAPFDGVRYMEAQRTNGSRIVTVEDMEVPRDVWYPYPSGNGVPASWVREHAFLLGKRPWVCVPHLANDALVEHMATELAGLWVQSPVVEYSNELWNTGFEQTRWCAEQAGGYSSGPEMRQQSYRYASQRTAEIAEMWRGIDPDVTVVFGVGMMDPPSDPALIDASDADAVVTAAYVGIESGWGSGPHMHVRDMGEDELLVWLAGESMDRCLDWVGDRISETSLPVWIYEGGQHLKHDVSDTFVTVQRRPEMADIYAQLLTGLDGLGVETFAHYSGAVALTNSTFGMIEQTGQTGPKWQALNAWTS